MATLATLRGLLNGEIGVDDADTTPWTQAVRNQAIRDGYAALYRAGVWKQVKVDTATVDGQWNYALSTVRRLERLELLDTSSQVVEEPRGYVEEDGSGAWQLRLRGALPVGGTLRVRGWGAYKSQFTNDADTDDLPAEYARIPLLKAKAILWRAALGRFMRTGESQAVPPGMNTSSDTLLASIAAAEREWAEETKDLAGLRRRPSASRPRR